MQAWRSDLSAREEFGPKKLPEARSQPATTAATGKRSWRYKTQSPGDHQMRARCGRL
jgi:hypothetical protein